MAQYGLIDNDLVSDLFPEDVYFVPLGRVTMVGRAVGCGFLPLEMLPLAYDVDPNLFKLNHFIEIRVLINLSKTPVEVLESLKSVFGGDRCASSRKEYDGAEEKNERFSL